MSDMTIDEVDYDGDRDGDNDVSEDEQPTMAGPLPTVSENDTYAEMIASNAEVVFNEVPAVPPAAADQLLAAELPAAETPVAELPAAELPITEPSAT